MFHNGTKILCAILLNDSGPVWWGSHDCLCPCWVKDGRHTAACEGLGAAGPLLLHTAKCSDILIPAHLFQSKSQLTTKWKNSSIVWVAAIIGTKNHQTPFPYICLYWQTLICVLLIWDWLKQNNHSAHFIWCP